MGMIVYHSSAAFIATAAKQGTAQSLTRPLTLTGKDVVRVNLTDTEYDKWAAESDPTKRAAILAASTRRSEMVTGKVQVTTAARDELATRILAAVDGDKELARVALVELFASGTVALSTAGSQDDSEAVALSMFPDDPAPLAEPVASVPTDPAPEVKVEKSK